MTEKQTYQKNMTQLWQCMEKENWSDSAFSLLVTNSSGKPKVIQKHSTISIRTDLLGAVVRPKVTESRRTPKDGETGAIGQLENQFRTIDDLEWH